MSLLTLDSEVGRKILAARLIAVLVVEDENDALHIAEALLEGGVNVMELTLRTPAAIPALKAILARFPEMTAGVGTILTPEQVDEVVASGAHFGVSPGVNTKVLNHAKDQGLPFGAGVMSPTDLDLALVEHGCHLLKFFPAESSGGLAHLKNISAPYRHLGIKFIPLGGINLGNLAQYYASDLIGAVGGSWLAPPALIAAKDWKAIATNAREATAVAAG